MTKVVKVDFQGPRSATPLTVLDALSTEAQSVVDVRGRIRKFIEAEPHTLDDADKRIAELQVLKQTEGSEGVGQECESKKRRAEIAKAAAPVHACDCRQFPSSAALFGEVSATPGNVGFWSTDQRALVAPLTWRKPNQTFDRPRKAPGLSLWACVAASSRARDLSASPSSMVSMSATAGWATFAHGTMRHRAKNCWSFGRTTRRASARSTR
jgi:hypothetical protein